MRIIFEEHQYKSADVQDVLSEICALQDVDKMVSVNYVGYFYNPHLNDCVFILPKVLLTDRQDGEFTSCDEYIVDGKKIVNPDDIIHPEGQKKHLSDEYRKFIYEFAIWIYRTLCVYKKKNPESKAIYYKQLPQEGRGHKHHANTLLDVILSMIRFNNENNNFFLFTIKNQHRGLNKINWSRTIATSQPILQDNNPVYLAVTNKRRTIDFDEELFIMFFSILQHLNETYGFRIPINCNYELLPRTVFKQYIIKGIGKKRLLDIRYKYFSDKCIEMWNLCYTFFDISHPISINTTQKEYLLARNFNVVFEDIIDELIGDSRKSIPAGLKDQYDGKRVDHMYRDVALTSEDVNNNQVYYIGDSKYYKLGNNLGQESVYKQYTYARNVIQWNINLFLNDDENLETTERDERKSDRERYMDIRLRGNEKDDVTEGYNVLPNFFISAFVNKERRFDAGNENMKNHMIERNGEKVHSTYMSYQFVNRLFDRDTLILSHYDVNFLYVIYLYARGKSGEKAWWKEKVRRMFRDEIRRVIEDKFSFRAIAPRNEGIDKEYIATHFKDVIGKIYNAYSDKSQYLLALDKADPNGNNEDLLRDLNRYFYVTDEIKLGENPSETFDEMRHADESIKKHIPAELVSAIDERCILTGYVGESESNYIDFVKHKAKSYDMKYLPSNIFNVKYFLPMVKGRIDGVYKISGISVKTNSKENETGVYLHIRFEKEFISLGNKEVQVYKDKLGSGQLHTIEHIMEVYYEAD